MTTIAEQHSWTKQDDIIAFYLSKFHADRFLGISLARIAKILSERPLPDGSAAVPMSAFSLSRRMSNFDYLDGKGAYSNYAKLSRAVYEEYKNASIIELRSLAIQILGITVRDSVEREFQNFCQKFLKPKPPIK